MSISNDRFFQAMFNTSLPRIVVKTGGPDHAIVARNDAYRTFLTQQHPDFERVLLSRVLNNSEVRPAGLEIIPIGGMNGHPEYLLISLPQNGISDIINFITSGVAILRGKQMVLEVVNRRMLQLWDRDESVKGKALLDFLPEIQNQEFPSLLQRVYTTGVSYKTVDAPVRLETPEGMQLKYMDFSYTALKNAIGETDGILVLAEDVTAQVLTRQGVETNENRFLFLLNAIPQQVWTASPEGRVDYVNQVMCDDLGKSTEPLIMNGWQGFIHPEDFTRCMDKYTNALKTGVPYVDEFRLLFADGKYHWHLGRLVPFIENGKIQLWIGTNTNIDLQKANELKKDEFLSVASHELKTPLTSIKAFNQLLQYTREEEKRNTFTRKSQENIIRLERLINDLLDVTRINAGKMVYTMKPFNFRTMLQESVENVQLTSMAHEIVIESAADVTYRGDRFRLEQVMQNMLMNAIKYSPDGGKVVVNCMVEHENIIVSVEDFGIGIAEKDLSRLFERYYRADNISMRFEGLGLGLFISSEIIKRHQGNFWIESTVGQGSTFFFRLPLQRSEKLDGIHITYVERGAYLYVDWIGFHNMATVKEGCMKIYEALKRHKATKVVNDNTNVLGSWSDAAEWVGEEWFPTVEKAGVKYFAWIYAPAAFSKMSANKSVEKSNSGISIRLFTDLSLGLQWIKEVD